jgi:hypothetical protein
MDLPSNELKDGKNNCLNQSFANFFLPIAMKWQPKNIGI